MYESTPKKLNILEIILILGPVIDVLTSLSQRKLELNISIGLIVRAFFIFFMVMYVFFRSTYKYKKQSIIYLIIILLYMVLFTINIYINKGIENLLFEVKDLIKAFYFPICIITIINYIKTINYKLNIKIFSCAILEYITLLFIPQILGLGYESYAEDKIGTIGWFFSANEISSILGILIIFVIFSYDYIKNKFLYVAVVTYSIYNIMQIGTKVPAIAACICIICFILINFIRYIMSKNKEKIVAMTFGISTLIIFIVIFFTSPVYKNLEIYRDYLISIREVNDNVIQDKDVYETDEPNYIEENQNNYETEQNNKIQDYTDNKVLNEQEIATIIHSGRAENKDEIQAKFNNSSYKYKILGLGKVNLEEKSYYLIEIDYYDILFNFGYLGFITYFIPVLVLLLAILKKINLDYIKSIISDNHKCCYIIGCVNALLLGAISGHTLVSPAVSIYIAIMLIGLYVDNK